jgi:hypothetical protein
MNNEIIVSSKNLMFFIKLLSMEGYSTTIKRVKRKYQVQFSKKEQTTL